MLSSSVIKNVSQAGHYYGHEDNYYTRDEGIEQSEWWGKGANKLQLSGQIDERKFIELLRGKLPTGEQLGKVIDGEMKHRPGWDLTFSAPKSVSIMAYVGGDKRLIDAHRRAVAVALATIERSSAQARVKTSDGMQYQNTGNLVAALYHHDLSRAKDPQLHTHAVVMNMTQRLDGMWRSLASQIGRYNENTQGEINGFIERVRHYNRYLSKIYETELAYQVKQLGYEITSETKSGIFEIKGVPQDVIKFFSKRRNQIEEQLEQKGLSGGKAAAVATLVTRDAKEEADRTKLKEQWEDDAKDLGLDCQTIVNASYQKNKGEISEQQKIDNIDKKVIDAIHKASRSLSVFQTTFSLEEVISEASTFAIQHSLSVDSLLSGIESQLSKGELISLPDPHGKTILMAKETLEDEKRLIIQIQDNKSLTWKMESYQLSNYLVQHDEVDSECHQHLKTIFNNDRIVMIEGSAAKEELIQPIVNIAKSANLNTAVLSPSLIGSRGFAREVKLEPANLWERIKSLFVDTTPKHYSVLQFLSNFNKDNKSTKNRPDLLIVDNAHLLSTHQKANLFEWNKANQSKLILLGNKDTLLPQQRGTSINELIEHGVPTISLSNKQSLLDKFKVKQDIVNSVQKMADKIVEVNLTDDRQHAMAKHYSNLSKHDRKSSWLVGQNKKSVEQLNLLTHQELTSNNKIRQNKQLNVLIPVFLQEGKAMLATSYKKDQIVRFNETYSSLSINRGEYLRVIHHHEKSNRVVLQKENGKEIIWNPDKVAGTTSGKVELFDEKKREIGIGESIIFHRSINSKKIVKGERFTVDDIKQGKMKLKNIDGKSVIIDFDKPYYRHIDYGYAETLYAIAHEKPTYLIAELPANSLQTDQRRFYQAVSQPKEAWVYTDDYKNLVTTLEKKSGDRLTAHETLTKAEELKTKLHALYDVLEKQLLKPGMDRNPDTVKKSINAIDYAMRHLAERKTGFTHKELIYVAMQQALGDVNQEMLLEVTGEMRKTGILIQANRNDGTLWTTAEAVKIEREILALASKDSRKLHPLISDDQFLKYCDQTPLRQEQVNAIKEIVKSTDRVLSIQGRAGTGKTTMMVTLNDILSSKELLAEGGYSLYGIAPTNKGVNELRARGIAAQTVDSFILDMQRLHENKQDNDFSKTLLVIDEASMVSNRKFLKVLKITHNFNFRQMIATGDTAQNPSIESGKPHELVQRALGDATIFLEDIQRQKNTILKEAVKAIYQGDVNETFSILKDSILEINAKNASDPLDKDLKSEELDTKYYQKRISAIANDYVSSIKTDENVQIIAPSHIDRKAVNAEVRSLLNEMSILKGEEHLFSVFSSKDMTGVERSEAANFQPEQIVRFTTSSGKSIKAGDYFTIKSTDQQYNLLTLKKMDDSGQEIIWQVPRSLERVNNTVEVFTKETRDLQVGDKIIWLRTNKKEGMYSSDFADVTRIEKGQITVKRVDNSLFTFNGNDQKYQHWDHAYAVTAHAAQGGSYSTILAIYESHRKKLANLKNFLVTITRPINHLRIYTDNTENLKENITKNVGDKTSSLEVIGEYPTKLKGKEKAKPVGEQGEKSPPTTRKISKKMGSKDQDLARDQFNKLSIERIKEGLNRNAEKIAVELLGQPKMKGSNFLKFGSNQGSLSVTTKGERQGWWNDFSDNGGGRGMLSFIQKYASLDKQKALEYGANWLGIYSDMRVEKNSINRIKNEAGSSVLDKKFKQEQKKKIEFAKKLAEQSRSINGTLAEKYLREHRGIILDKYPEDIRFHPGIYSKLNGKTIPAMLVIARDNSGQIRAVQATYLDVSTAKKIDESIAAIQKQTFGLVKGATVNIHGEKSAPTLIAEGTETGLSLASALKNVNLKITLSKSNFKNIDSKSLTEKVVFCVDNDGLNIKSDKLIAESAKRLVDSNKHVSFMLPTCIDSNKQDYNDVLKQQGQEAIRRDFDNKISYQNMYELSLDKDKNNLITHYKNSVDQEEKSISVLAQNINIHAQPQPITDKMITSFSNELSKNNHQIQIKNVTAYKSSAMTHDHNDIQKTIPKVKEIERDI